MPVKTYSSAIPSLARLAPQSESFSLKRLWQNSVQTKVFLALLSIFFLILTFSLWYTFISQRELAHNMMKRQTEMTAHFYVDNINLLMVNDEMDHRDIVQNKMMEQPGIVEARIIRSDLINETYGEGFPDQYPGKLLAYN